MASFTLNTGHERALSGFQNRTSDVFSSLGCLEQAYDDGLKQRGPDEFIDNDRNSPERDRSFKIPVPPRHRSGRSHGEHSERQSRDRPQWKERGGRPSSHGEGRQWQGKRQRTPDYKLHPEKWTQYSLEETDVSGESTNKRAAIDFLRELRERKAKEQRTEEWDASLHCGKIEYRKPVQKSSHDSAAEGKKSSDVHKMPEYVIGQAKSKSNTSKSKGSFHQTGASSSGSKTKTISLGHLGEEDETDQSHHSLTTSDQSQHSKKKLGQSAESDEHDLFQSNQSETSNSSSGSSVDPDMKGKSGKEKESVSDGSQFQKKGKGKRKIRERTVTEDEG